MATSESMAVTAPGGFDVKGIALSPEGGVKLRSIGEAFGFAKLIADGGWLPKGVSQTAAVLAIAQGASIGLNPFQSVQQIAVVNGRPTLYGDGLNAAVRRSGLVENEKVEKFRAADGHVVAVRVTVWRKGMKDPIVGEFSEKMARQAGLWGKPGPWSQYPDRMMFNRARAFAYRDGFADVLSGVRSAEEEEDAVRGRGAAVVEAQVVEAAPAEEEKPRKRKGRRSQASELLEEEAALAEPLPFDGAPVEEAGTPATEGSAGTADGSAADVPADFL